MTGLHGVTAPLTIVGLSVLAAVATAMAAIGRDAVALEWARRIALGILVAEAAVGLALALRGAAPTEAIHWVYGVAVLVLLIVPGSMSEEVSPRVRTGALAVGAAIAAALAWRLWSSG